MKFVCIVLCREVYIAFIKLRTVMWKYFIITAMVSNIQQYSHNVIHMVNNCPMIYLQNILAYFLHSTDLVKTSY